MNFFSRLISSIFGINIKPNPSGDISSPEDGDIWYNDVIYKFRKRQGGITSDLDSFGDRQLDRVEIDTGVYSTFAIDTTTQLYNITGTGTLDISLPPLDTVTENIYLAFFDGHKNTVRLNGAGDNLIPIVTKNSIQNAVTTTYTIQSSYCELIGVYGNGWYIIDQAPINGQLNSTTIDTSGTGPWDIEPLKYQIYKVAAGDPAIFDLPQLDEKIINIPIYILNQNPNSGSTLTAFSGDYLNVAGEILNTTTIDINSPITMIIGTKDTVYGFYYWNIVDTDPRRLLPPGGTTGQVLSKVNGTDYNLTWTTPSGGGGGLTTITGTINADFGVETDSVTTTVANASITNALLKTVSFLPIKTSSTSLDDFMLNGVQMNIENIIDNTSFDIRATASNNASGIYQFKYIINI